jgi:LEA14-like dessication related protein
MNAQNRLQLPLVLCLLFFLTGCAHVSALFGIGPKKPTVKFESIDITSVALTGIKMQINLNVFNPNGYDLAFQYVDYEVTALEQTIAKDRFFAKKPFLAEQWTPLEVPMSLKTLAVVDVISSFLQDPQKVSAHIKGVVAVDTIVGLWEIPFAEDAKIGAKTKK